MQNITHRRQYHEYCLGSQREGFPPCTSSQLKQGFCGLKKPVGVFLPPEEDHQLSHATSCRQLFVALYREC